MYDSAPCLKMWRERLVPTAIALTSLYEPESWTLPTGEPIDTRTRSFFMHSLDAIAIRSRAAIMSDFARRYATSDGGVTRWTSIACGAAIPVLDAVEKHVGTAAVHLKLIDFDPNALDHARDKAVDRGLVEAEHFESLRRDVVKDLIVGDNLVRELGAESQQFVDMLGIFEDPRRIRRLQVRGGLPGERISVGEAGRRSGRGQYARHSSRAAFHPARPRMAAVIPTVHRSDLRHHHRRGY